jgi:pyruvate/2-oxoglutarate dehydrogenase complex dihydrolipoamide acyltransferase (E2) component
LTAAYAQVLVPRESANDDYAILVSWSCADGDAVKSGDTICELEFSKAVVEITAPRDGYLFHLKNVADEVAVGKPMGIVASDSTRPTQTAPAARPPGSTKVSLKAQELIDAHGIDPAEFTGIAIVKEKHVLAWLQSHGEESVDAEVELIPVTPQQKRAAAALSESTRQIPHSWLTRWVDAERIDTHVQTLARQHDMMVSVSDRLVQAVAQSAGNFKKVNAAWSDKRIACYSKIHVGFALNQANGDLLVPVIHNAGEMDLETLVGRIRGLQKAAVRHKLSPGDLTGGTITVTSLVGSGMHQVSPILVPGQSCIVAIGDRCEVFGRAAYALTIGFDHRVLNGSEAAEFLVELADKLESPPPVAASMASANSKATDG